MTVIVTSSLLHAASPATATSESFTSFVKVIGDSLSAAGWINTNAIGGINTSSATPPPASTRSTGYQVFSMNDVLHNNGYPVYIRLDYGNIAVSTTRYSVAVTVGFDHDGSGSVGGSNRSLGIGNTGATSMVITTGGAPNSGALYDHRVCIISGGDMGILIADNLPGAAAFGFVERTKDVYGNVTNEGVIVGTHNANAPEYRQSYLMYTPLSASQVPVPETFQNYVHSSLATSRNAQFLSVGLFIPMVQYGPHNLLRMMGLVKSSDFVTNATYTINVYNTSSTYFVSSNIEFSDSSIVADRSFTTNNRLIMRSE